MKADAHKTAASRKGPMEGGPFAACQAKQGGPLYPMCLKALQVICPLIKANKGPLGSQLPAPLKVHSGLCCCYVWFVAVLQHSMCLNKKLQDTHTQQVGGKNGL